MVDLSELCSAADLPVRSMGGGGLLATLTFLRCRLAADGVLGSVSLVYEGSGPLGGAREGVLGFVGSMVVGITTSRGPRGRWCFEGFIPEWRDC